MNFSDKKYAERLIEILNTNKENSHSELDCFYQLIDVYEIDKMENLINLIIDNRKIKV